MVDLLLCIGPGQHAPPAPWVSVEAVHRDTQPLATIVLKDGQSLPDALADAYPDGFTVRQIFCGHMWEHVHQNEMLALAREYFALLAPGGQMGVIQPDFRIAMNYYKDGLISIDDAMRHGDVGDTWDRARWTEWYRAGELDHWAMHKCNSVPERFVGLFTAVGFEVEEREPTYEGMAGWPITGSGGAQCAMICTKPS